MRVVFVNRFYWPDEPATGQLLTDLAERLVERGFTVTVITSHPGDAVPRETVRGGVRILRVRTPLSASTALSGKASEWASFLLAACSRLLHEVRRGDFVVAMTDPPFLGIGARLAARMRGARVIHWVQDIYPELAMVLAGQRWLGVLRPLRNCAWRGAAGCVTLGTDLAATLSACGVAGERIHVIANWAPAGLTPQPPAAGNELRAAWGLTGKFVVAYSGNLGRVHDLERLLDVAEALRDDQRIVFLFVGDGAQRASLEATATQRRLANVLFRPPQPRARLAESLAAGDVHLVTLRAGCEHYVFPSKLYGIAAVGRPMIFVGPRDSELARLVTDRGLGLVFSGAEGPALAAALRMQASDPERGARFASAAREFAVASGGADAAADRWNALLSACAHAKESRA